MNYYHPQTLEYIRNPLPAVADWANATALTVPEYDLHTHSCRFVGGGWLVEENEAPPNPRITELKNELAALDIKRIRPTAEGDTAYLITLNAQAVALRAELQALL